MTLSAPSLPDDTRPVVSPPIASNDDVASEFSASSDSTAAPDKATRYCVVVNANAGSSSGFSEDAIRQAAPDAHVEVKTVGPDDLNAAFDWAFGEKPCAVIIVGGDGTARTAAVRAVDTGVPIIPMPGGTMNVLPKIIFGHGDLARAIRELPHLKPRGLDVGVVAGEMFFLSAAFGFAGPMTRLREATRSDKKTDADVRSRRRPPPQHRPVAAVSRELAHPQSEVAQRPLAHRRYWRHQSYPCARHGGSWPSF